MFTGIVEEIGHIISITPQSSGLRLVIAAKNILDDVSIGASIAVNGACLTVVNYNDKNFTVDVVPETLRRTNLGNLVNNSIVNLERAARINARLDGHIVQGHIDTMAQLKEIKKEGNAYLATFTIASSWMKYIVPKGYVAIDGMSITVIEAGDDYFTVTFVPHTYAATRTQYYQVGDGINIEVDILGKYIERLLAHAVKPE